MKGIIQAVMSKPCIVGADITFLPYRSTKLWTIGSTLSPFVSRSRISAHIGVAELQFCIAQTLNCSLHPHWQTSRSHASL